MKTYKKIIIAVSILTILGLVGTAIAVTYYEYTEITTPHIIFPEDGQVVVAGQEYTFECETSTDTDSYYGGECAGWQYPSDNVVHTWSGDGYFVTNIGTSVTWTAPNAAGPATITLTVDDTGSPNYYDSNSKSDSVDLTVTNLIYVDKDATSGENNGSSWANAFIDLQDAFDAAESGGEIWVADGTYKPGSEQSSTFQLINGVALYGGFSGVETSRNQRNWQEHETILSGDIGAIDDANDNCYHVVTGSGTNISAKIDGFTITAGGDADYVGEEEAKGGGMYNVPGSPTVINCTFNDNYVRNAGGGMYNCYYSSPTVTNCTFTNNTSLSGGGMCNFNHSSPTITNCAFIGNKAESGGGMCNSYDGTVVVTNCTFSGNEVDNSSVYGSIGGGILNFKNSATITNCTFNENSAKGIGGTGGGIHNAEVDSITVENCAFSGNTALGGGGGACNWQWYYSSSPCSFTNCSFNNNEAISGAGMFNWNTGAVVTNCSFSGNAAEQDGGGMRDIKDNNDYYECSMLTNCTFSGNTAGCFGGGIKADHLYFKYHTVTVTNCIFWGNDANDAYPLHDNVSGTPWTDVSFSYSDIEDSNGSGDGWYNPFGTDNGHNIDSDPDFVDDTDHDGDDNILGTSDDGLELSAGSPCIDEGNNNAISEPNDITGNPRKVDGDGDQTVTVDMGAYEYQGS
jgi:predicted outer membrane repeat protein